MSAEEYPVVYKVKPTKAARRQGQKCGLSTKALLELIEEVKLLKYWPHNADNFDHEKVNGAIEFKFNFIENKWIRVFAYQDDDQKIMWIIKVLAKKTNTLSTADKISLKTAVSTIESEIKNFLKEQAKYKGLKAVKGGKDEHR